MGQEVAFSISIFSSLFRLVGTGDEVSDSGIEKPPFRDVCWPTFYYLCGRWAPVCDV